MNAMLLIQSKRKSTFNVFLFGVIFTEAKMCPNDGHGIPAPVGSVCFRANHASLSAKVCWTKWRHD